MAISQFQDQLAGSANPLSPDQDQQLIQALNEERTNFKWTTDYNNKNAADVDYSTMFTPDKMATFATEKTQLDDLVLARAKQILSPDQFTSFQTYQVQQRDMQIAGMKMAAQMFSH
jgi:hypothetical protein